MDVSGWCLWPVNEKTAVEHDRCPKHFRSGECACPCEHKGERTVEEREGTGEVKEVKPKRTRKKSAAKPE